MASIISNQQQPHFYQAFNEREPVRTELEEYKIMNQFLSNCGEEPFEFNLLTDYLPPDLQDLVMSYRPEAQQITEGKSYRVGQDVVTIIKRYDTNLLGEGITHVFNPAIFFYKDGDNRVSCTRRTYTDVVKHNEGWQYIPRDTPKWLDIEAKEIRNNYGLFPYHENIIPGHFTIDGSKLSEFTFNGRVVRASDVINETSPRAQHYLQTLARLEASTLKQITQECREKKIKWFSECALKSQKILNMLMSGKM